MKSLELIVTQSKTTKVSVDIPDGLSSRDEYKLINDILSSDDMDKLIFDEASEELEDIEEISGWDIIE